MSDGAVVAQSGSLLDEIKMVLSDQKKLHRVAFHVTRAAKKFLVGTGNAAWVMGTTMLVMVMPLVFEIDKEQQSQELELQGAVPRM